MTRPAAFANATPDPTGDHVPFIDTSDTSGDASGTEKKCSPQVLVESTEATLAPVDWSADNRLIRTIGTSGRDVEESAVAVGDTGAVTGVSTLLASGAVTAGSFVTAGTVDGVDVSALSAAYTAHDGSASEHGVTGNVVGTGGTQTLTSKTLTTPVIGDFTNAQHNHSNAAGGGVLDPADIPFDNTISGLTADDVKEAIDELAASVGSSGDPNAIHDNVAGEIAAITEKEEPVAADLLVIEDSEDSNNKKSIQIGSLPGGGSGDVVGPATATDEAVARFDGTTGELLQDSVVTITNAGAATGFTTINASGAVTVGSLVTAGNVDGRDVSTDGSKLDGIESGAINALAGAGMTKTGSTLDVIAGDASIVVSANSLVVGVLQSDAMHGARGGGTQHADAVASGAAGFMTGADKAKLDGIEAAAINALGGAGMTKTGSTLNVIANADASIVVNANDIQVGVLATDAQHGNRGGGGIHSNVVAGGAAGFMSGSDKTKLDALVNVGIAAGNYRCARTWAMIATNNLAAMVPLSGGSVTAMGTSGIVATAFATNEGWTRNSLTSAAATNSTGGVRNSGGSLEFAPGADAQATPCTFRGSFATADALSSCRGFMGWRVATSDPGSNEPSTFVNCAGVGYDSDMSQYVFMHNDGSGACTEITLGGGSGFPCNTNAADKIELEMAFTGEGNAQTLHWSVRNRSGNVENSGTITSNLPAAGSLLNVYAFRNTAANSSACVCHIGDLCGGTLAGVVLF